MSVHRPSLTPPPSSPGHGGTPSPSSAIALDLLLTQTGMPLPQSPHLKHIKMAVERVVGHQSRRVGRAALEFFEAWLLARLWALQHSAAGNEAAGERVVRHQTRRVSSSDSTSSRLY